MGRPLLAIVTIVYLAVAANYVWIGRPGMAIVFLGYSAANIGFIWDMM